MPLTVDVGHSSLTGPRERNEDFCGMVTPHGADLENKGLIAAVADGIGGHKGGREAAEYTVRSLLSDYYATPETWSVPHALEKVVVPLNRWVMAEAGRQPELAGMATTLTTLVLRGRRYVCAHVGDSRLYLLRDGVCRRLTTDHVWEHPELRNVLSRAVGLDRHFHLDFADGELQEGDCFLLCSDGVWGVLDKQRICGVLIAHPDAQQAAASLTSLALASGGQDNASAVVLRVAELPAENLRDSLEGTSRLPLPPRFKFGQTFDGLRIDEVLHDSRATLLYRVTDQFSGQPLVLKTLRPELADDADEIRALIMEEWRARRIVSPFFPQLLPAERRSCLYYLQTWHEGATLQRMLDADMHFTVADTVLHGILLMKGLSALHRLDVVHRDIKPANIHLGRDGRLRILDLGVARSLSEDEIDSGNPGTPSYMAPELFSGERASTTHDLYAAGVVLYHLLTRKYPYGEIEPFQHPKFGEPLAPTRYRPDIPGWLENILLKAVAKDPAQRFETAEEFLLALERGATRPLNRPPVTPLALRNPLLTWRIIASVSLFANLLMLMLLTR
ncbi:bifunctional protein-serine/threonine kinase/phosphatase [Candidatus Accumulibacter phosphatis]|uniref:Serine/threonine protein kinase n=1 Tax=Candidatus Accumulibacter phosphatis TaxID=327160 RepID=A0A5S4EMY9_9PROT|nr:bifunctional protein-serine/threonine kinase/phosphatase [Candidatus Accumulibacter phosphatis]TMQ76729.1 Serine/threonine protein kinase [Candidatus Accumulibacter phosphatis]